MKTLHLFPLLAMLALGCETDTNSRQEPEESTAVANEETTPQNDKSSTQDVSVVKNEDNDNDDGYWENIKQHYEKAKSSGKTTAKSVKEWIAETYGSAKSKGKVAADVSADWIKENYEQAKESGETTASSAKEWLAEDLSKIGSWEYKTLVVNAENSESVEAELNKLGAERWECFWVDKQGATTTFYLKKAGRSYLKQVPARELLRMLPFLMSDSGE